MSAEKAGTVAEKFLSAVQDLDVQAALACLHPEVQLLEPESLPYGGAYTGVEGFMTVFTKLTETASISLLKFEVFDGGTVAIGRIQLLLRSHATGAELESPFVELYTVQDGLITQIDVYPKDTKRVAAFLTTGVAGSQPDER